MSTPGVFLPRFCCVTRLTLSQPGVSKHLKVLREAGLVRVRPDGKQRWYRLHAEPLAEVDYAELVDPADFRSPGRLAVLAARFGSTRLIDNHLLGVRFETFPSG